MSMKSSWELWRKVKNVIAAVQTVVDLKSTTTDGTIVTDVIAGTPKIVTPASSGSANTFGSWVAYDASTSAISWVCGVTIGVPARAKTIDAQIDIGVSESTKISIPFNYFYKTDVGYLPTIVVTFPIPIKVAASGAIDIRASDSEANANTYRVGLIYYQGI